MSALTSYRIVELGIGPVTGIAGMIMADFGAEVIKVSPVQGDPFRSMPSYPMWMRGKTEIRLDLNEPNTTSKLHNLIIDDADAFVTTLKCDTLSRLGLDEETMRQNRSSLVCGYVSGFGTTGPYRDYPGYEGLVAAKSGRMLNFAGVADREGPNFSALQVGVHATSQSVAAALMAGLDNRERTGHGTVFNTSLLRGMMPYEMGVISMAQLQDKGILPRPKVQRDRTKSMPTLNYHPVRTKDGKWLQLGNLLPHLLDNFLRSAGFDMVFKDEKYRGDPMTWDRTVLEEFRDHMLEHMQSRTLEEWTEHFVEDGGVVSHAYQSTQDALADLDVVANGHSEKVNGGVQLGLVANLTETPGKIGDPHRSATLDEVKSRPSKSARSVTGNAPQRALEGVTIVESATIIAAPLGAATLADMGARVIKLEPIAGDPFRNMMSSLGASKCNTGKESICLDLKSAEGQAIAQELAKKADVWIHNYRMGVPEKLGIGYDELAKLNPQLVYISANGYGPNGPGAKRPSTHPIPGAALGGVVWQIGGLPDEREPADNESLRETARKLLRANEVNPDPNTSMVVATTAVLGLHARRASGKGQKIYIDMFGANAYANWDDFLSYEGKAERAPVDKEGFGLNPLYRLYRCSEGWVFLGVVNAREKSMLQEALTIDIDSSDLESTLEATFLTKTAHQWETELTPLGIGCVVADDSVPPIWFLKDEHAKTERLLVPAQHPEWGDYYRLGPMVEFDRSVDYAGTELAGGSTVSLLKELNFKDDSIERLLAEGIVRAA
ncbi:MAG: CoA transferase [Gammaproteobacteria bacterium]|nr:CoA transferase [Gammaproteobacteria bacterium]